MDLLHIIHWLIYEPFFVGSQKAIGFLFLSSRGDNCSEGVGVVLTPIVADVSFESWNRLVVLVCNWYDIIIIILNAGGW